MESQRTEIECPIAAQARRVPNSVFLRDARGELSYGEADRLVQSLTGALHEREIHRGERVAVLAKNSAEYVLFVFAAQRLGVSLIPLNLRLTKGSWREQLSLAGARHVFHGEETQLDSMPSEWNSTLFAELFSVYAQKRAPQERQNLPLSQEATLVFTSGSTGAGKGVRLSVRNHYFSALQSNEVTGLHDGDCWYLSLPLFHVGGLEIAYRAAIAGAAIYVAGQVFSGPELLSLLKESRATHVSLVPTVLQELIALPGGPEMLRGMDIVLLGGAPAEQALLESALEEGVPLLSSYGMTETTSHCTCTRLADRGPERFTSGRALRFVDVRIIDEDGKPCPAGETGEIVVRGATVCAGYLGHVTAQNSGSELWFSTGDAGVLDAVGYLRVLGRKDGMFISGGENIYPAEIETAARTCLGVKDCAVLSAKHEKWGARPVLFVEMHKHEIFDEKRLRAVLEKTLPPMKLPDLILNVDCLPRTAIGKVEYAALRGLSRAKRTLTHLE